MEKINIAELLKDCPSGMELDCAIFENVTFEEVITARGFDDKKRVKIILSTHYSDGTKDEISLTEFGTYIDDETAKCVIFPKGKTTWEGFVPPCKFKDGDIIYVKSKSISNTELVGIYKKEDSELIYDYCSVSLNSKSFYHDNMGLINKNIIDISRLATDAEKVILFQAIKDNGYYWNVETKNLEKLEKFVEPKFKVGDEIAKRNSISNSWIVSSVSSEYYGLKLPKGIEGIGVLPVSEQDDWELLPNIKPKFKVGDAIQDKDGYKVKIIEVNLEDKCYGYESIIAKGIGGIAFSEQNNWKLVPNIEPKFKVGDKIEKLGYRFTIIQVNDNNYLTKCGNKIPIDNQDDFTLVPNKFDITTLKPFESKVLVRDKNNDKWIGQFFSHYDNGSDRSYVCIGIEGLCEYKKCIPFKNNEYLLGTNDDCNEYYKTW